MGPFMTYVVSVVLIGVWALVLPHMGEDWTAGMVMSEMLWKIAFIPVVNSLLCSWNLLCLVLTTSFYVWEVTFKSLIWLGTTAGSLFI